ncbi:hypothetical protein NMY22_g13597 [Coprinellus aureogranulatus]|nr:hypothetical protein NMY22_g13597 [Coprinellus aureogranulatus]
MFNRVQPCLQRATRLALQRGVPVASSSSGKRVIVPLASSQSFSTSPRISSTLPTPPHITRLPDPNAESQNGKNADDTTETLNRVRQWVDRFKDVEPKALRDAKGVEMSFSRSSGPGGQNVNKVNTKVTLRCAVDAAWIPPWAKEVLVKDPHYTPSSHSILVTSTTTRSQAQNIDDCLTKLRNIVLNASTVNLMNATSEETKKRVEGLMKAEKAQRRMDKERRSSVKRNRSFKGFD